MSTPQVLSTQLADALIAGDQDAVIAILAQVIALVADVDTPLAKALRDESSATLATPQSTPHLIPQVHSERVARRADPVGDMPAPAVVASVEKYGVEAAHVPVVSDMLATDVCDICGKAPCECTDGNFIITKAGEEKRLAYGVVSVPNVADSQGDVMTADTIEKMAHAYLAKSRSFDLQHLLDLSSDKAEIVESYVAPCDFMLGSKLVKAGSWIAVTHFLDESLWSMVRMGQIKAYSIRGYGTRIPDTTYNASL